MAGHTIRFSADDLILFSAASGDWNPRPLSAAYAAKAPYGQQVVFGALGAMACLGQLGLAGGDRIERITAAFFRPMFLDVEYELRVNEQDGIRTGRLYDGSILVMALAVTLRGTGGKPEVRREREPHFELPQGRAWDTRALVPGLAISGSYECDPAALDALRSRWGAGADTIAADCLLWSSYLVGMELPGISALFFRLVLNLEEDVALSGPLDYSA